MPAEKPRDIAYRIKPVDPHGHLFEVELQVRNPNTNGQILSVPAWIPGSYMIRDFARHIVAISAHSGRRVIALTKLDKQTWQAEPCRGLLRVTYRVYAWDLSVRGAHLDDSHGFFNGTSVFLAVAGQTDRPVSVRIDPPAGSWARRWRVATTLPSLGAKEWGFGGYGAANYDELIDHPVEMGEFLTVGFMAGGARHEIVVSGAPDTDMQRLAHDLKPVCEVQAALFEPRTRRAPVDRYLFLTYAVGHGYGGLEHRSSTALICSRNDLPWVGMTGQPEKYRTFLGLCSHEYFHTWNVKRIKPAVFAPYRLEDESYTELLWVFEGFTSYYDDLMLVRSGVVSLEDYLAGLATAISIVERTHGRTLQSAAESSFDAWTRFYRQDENSTNAIVSYYKKGSLVALAIDLTLRLRSGQRKSLDDVMRLLWTRHGRDFTRDGTGVPEGGMPALIHAATGIDVGPEIAQWAHGTSELPLASLFKQFGFRLTFEAPSSAGTLLGVRLSEGQGGCAIAAVFTGGPGHAAGLSAGDLIVACNNLRIEREQDLQETLTRIAGDAVLKLHLFRADKLQERQLQLAPAPAVQAKLEVEELAGRRIASATTRWLRGVNRRK